MATVSGSLIAAGISAPFTPATTRFKVQASGTFMGAAVLMRSVDNGATWQASPTQGPVPNAPLFTGTNGTGLGQAVAEITDAAVGVLYALQAYAPAGGTFTGELDFTFTDVALATVTVAPGRSLISGATTYGPGQTTTIDRADADMAFKAGMILASY